MKCFIIIFIILGCSNSFAENNYRKEIENYAESLILAKYNDFSKKNNNEKVSIKISPLNKQLNLKQCINKITGEIVGGKLKKSTSVKITCPDNKGWTTYIRARVEILVPSVATSLALSKGQALTSTNIKLILTEKSQTKNGRFTNIKSLIGTRLKRNLSEEKIIKDRDVCFVCKNDKVIITAVKNGLLIKASGIALNDANIGRTVRVKNSRTQRIVVGTVSALNEVQISF